MSNDDISFADLQFQMFEWHIASSLYCDVIIAHI